MFQALRLRLHVGLNYFRRTHGFVRLRPITYHLRGLFPAGQHRVVEAYDDAGRRLYLCSCGKEFL